MANTLIQELKSFQKVLVETPEEFLSTFNVSQLMNNNIIQHINNIIQNNQNNSIGMGCIGKIYSIAGQQYVIKVSEICPINVDNNQPFNLLKDLCDLARGGNLIFRIPDTHQYKEIILGPDHIIELLVGILIKSITKKYTPSFMDIFGFQYDSENPRHPTYIVSERLENINDAMLSVHTNFYFIMFQLMQTLHVAQQTSKYVHYDLHSGNIMYRENANGQREVNIYGLENGEYLYTYFNFDTVIIDYGHNRMETVNNILVPRMKFRSPSSEDIIDFYEYNPYYDVFTVIYNAYKRLRHNPHINNHIFRLLYKLLKPQQGQSDIDAVNDMLQYILLSPISWRPYPERLMTQKSTGNWFNVSSSYDMMMVIIDHLKGALPDLQNPNLSNPNNLLNYLYQHNFYISNQILSLPPGTVTNIYTRVPQTDRMELTHYNYQITENSNIGNGIVQVEYITPNNFENYNNNRIRMTRASWNHTPPQSVINSNNYNNQHIHVATINQEAGLLNGYTFKFDCCRIDLRNYFQTQYIQSGIAINASFFKLFETYMPVGSFKTENFISDIPVPDVYKPYGGVIVVTKNGLLDIVNINETRDYPQYLTAGPMLVTTINGVPTITFDDTIMNTRNNSGYFIFQCRLPITRVEKTRRVFDDNIFNCDRINSAELSHASNSNNRSALLITANNEVKLIYVEGRDDRGAGMDLQQLGQFCIAQGAVKAINLDGGSSSQFMWKKPGESLIHVATGEPRQAYPVGTIISFTKKA